MKQKKENICVIGLGYIGLPTASMFATNGYKVHGVDINSKVVKTLQEGRIHIEEPGLATVVKAAISSKNLLVDSKVKPSDVFIIAVPTPSNTDQSETPKADMSFVTEAMESILPHLKKGNLIILESTSPPGTTRDLIIPMIEKKGLKPGEEIGVAYCPERVIPGQALKELVGNDRVVGAIDDVWGKKTRALYKSFVSGEIFLTNPTVAEMVKILENTYRDVNIALANEVSHMCEELNISTAEVIQIANRHPRVHVHKPGPGVGGHCISVDPWFLVEKFPSLTKIIKLARDINDGQPEKVVEKMKTLLDEKKKAKIAILGIAYKGNVDDIRESPAIEVIKILKKDCPNWRLSVCDPHVETSDYPKISIQEALTDADLAVILTPHEEFRTLQPQEIGSFMKNRLVYDTQNILNAERWVPAGFVLHSLGTGSSKKNRSRSSK